MSKYCPIEKRNVTYLFCKECEDKYCDNNYITCYKNCINYNTCNKYNTTLPSQCKNFIQK